MRDKILLNGVPWYDQNGEPVNAHAGNLIKVNGRYYLFGEYKTNDENKYIGFSRYVSNDLINWRYEGLALTPQIDGLLGPGRIGERVKVVQSKATGKFVMLMHTDDLTYTDPCIGYAVSDTVDGEFEFKGPLLFEGKPIRMWDMGAFTDEDGTVYLLIHEGDIYRLKDSCDEIAEQMTKGIAPGGESPAMFKHDDYYFIMYSNKTSWERNDNYYFSAKNISGPWTRKGLFCPEESWTFNSQCSNVFMLDTENGRVPMYMGDRWSFPKQRASGTQVWLPIQEISNDEFSIPRYFESWDPTTLQAIIQEASEKVSFKTNQAGKQLEIAFLGEQILVFGEATPHSGYAKFEIFDDQQGLHHTGVIDFYRKSPESGLRYASPQLEFGAYTLMITVLGENSFCIKKDSTRFGSDDDYIEIHGYSSY